MVNPLIDRKDKDFNPDDLFYWIDIMGQRYGWTADYILEMPIPLFLTLQRTIIEADKQAEAKAKKISKK